MEQPNYIHKTDVHNTNAANEILPFIFEKFNPKSVIDIGCGTGSWLSVAKKLGAIVKGIEGNYIDDEMLCIDKSEFELHDLTTLLPLEQKFDLAISLEVAEHLPENAAKTIVTTLTDCSDIILFSAALPNQKGQNHINEQWPEYWRLLFNEKEFYPVDILRPIFWENPNVDWWYKQNMLIYTTKNNIVRYGLNEAKIVNRYIHPELLKNKMNEYYWLEKKIEYEANNPKFIASLKNMIKSLKR